MVTRYFLKGIRGSFEVTSKKGATVEVPVTFFPGWQVRVNNQKVKVGPGDNLGLLAFAIPSGTSSVKFWFGDTPVRTLANLISLASLAVVFLLLKKSHAA